MSLTTSIMIIDDDTDDIEIFCDAVHEIDQEIECVPAFNCIDALKMLRTGGSHPDFIFLDLNLPKMNGKQCLEEIKKIDALHNTPVVIYSTSKIKDDIEQTKKLGASCFITKPNKFSLLKNAISAVLRKNWVNVSLF
jgi:CheY-like chemotaxis protein